MIDQQFTPLLSSGDPNPVNVLNENGYSELVVVCDHAGNAIPQSLGNLGLPAELRQAHIAWDIGAWDIATGLSKRFDAPLVAGVYSRLVYDLNRYPWDPFSMTSMADTHSIPGNKDLSAPEMERRLHEVAKPYYAKVNRLLDSRLASGKCPILISVHTMTDQLKSGSPREEAFAVLAAPNDELSRQFLADLSESTDLVVGDNTPYALELGVDYTVPECALRRGVPAIMFEVRQDLTVEQSCLSNRIDELTAAISRTLEHWTRSSMNKDCQPQFSGIDGQMASTD